MAKQPSSKGGTSRIRFIMLDAEIPEGQLADVTAAIQNALKPAVIMQPRLPPQAPQARQIVDARVNGEAMVEETEEDVEEPAEVAAPRKPKAQKRSKPSSPKVVEDVDLRAHPSLEAYVSQYPPKTELDKNLVVAAFFSEHRPDVGEISMHHVYTCYRALGWGTGNADFSAPLRKLKSEQFLKSGSTKGSYIINHLGLDRVHKLAGGG